MTHAHANAAYNLRRTIEDAEVKLRLLEKIPARDNFPHLTMVRVVVRPRLGNDDERTYLLLKVISDNQNQPPIWYFTGRLSGRGRLHDQRTISWEHLVKWLVYDVELQSWDELTPKTVGETLDEMTR